MSKKRKRAGQTPNNCSSRKGKGQPIGAVPGEEFALCRCELQLLFGCGGGCGFCSGVGVFLGKAFDAARGVQKLLLSGKERVAVGTDFNVQPFTFYGGTGLEVVSARAVDGNGVIVGMNTGFHESPFCRGRSAPNPAMTGSTEASLGREVTPHYSK